MDRTSLKRFLNEGLSLAEIGRRVGLHEATVGYWVEKHGLQAVNRAKHAPRGGLDRAELERLVDDGASIARIAHTVGRSRATVRHWLGKYGLRTKGSAVRSLVRAPGRRAMRGWRPPCCAVRGMAKPRTYANRVATTAA